MIAGFLTFTGVTVWACAVIWAVDTLLRRLDDHRLNRHIDEALRMGETPVEDRPEWGTR